MLDSLISLFVTPAYAAAPAAAANTSQGSAMSMGLMVLMFAVFYFLIIRPQSKRQKDHQNIVSSVTRGDEILTNGGFFGQVVRIDDSYLCLMLAEGVEVIIQKSAINSILPKGTLKGMSKSK